MPGVRGAQARAATGRTQSGTGLGSGRPQLSPSKETMGWIAFFGVMPPHSLRRL